MAGINFHPNDRMMSTLELAKNVGLAVFVISVFEGMFYAMYLEGQILMPLLCGVPLGLILIMLLCQSLMHLSGFGKMVINDNEMVLRTPRSGKGSRSILDPLARVMLSPVARMAMRSMDKDGDGRLSFDEVLEHMGEMSKSEYAEVREMFDRYDEDGDGYISVSEMEQFISSHNDDNWAEEKPSNWWTSDDD